MSWVSVVLLTVHLLAVNLAAAGPLLGIWLGRAGLQSDPLWDRVGRKLAWWSVAAMLMGMLTGGAQFLLLPSPGLQAALARLPSRALWFAGLELVFSLVLLLLYAGCWNALRSHRWWHASLALLSSSNLLYHFPPLMSVLGMLASDPHWSNARQLDRATMLPLMMRSEVLALTTHFIFASVAVSAMAVIFLTSRIGKENWKDSAVPLARRAAWIALAVTLLQLPVGFWLLVVFPVGARMAMMGGSALASLSLLCALLLTYMLLQKLLAIALGTAGPIQMRSTCWVLITLVLLMTSTLQTSRSHERPAEPHEKKAVESEAPRRLSVQ